MPEAQAKTTVKSRTPSRLRDLTLFVVLRKVEREIRRFRKKVFARRKVIAAEPSTGGLRSKTIRAEITAAMAGQRDFSENTAA